MIAPLEAIERELASAIEQADYPPALDAALRYAALDGGKRLRPLLAWHACEAVCGRGEPSLPACAAVELVHAFSLVHDDLPCMDNDDLRRGRPTLHKHAGEAIALLAGDAMLALAFATVARGAHASLSSPLTTELAQATSAMIVGQTLDTLGHDEPAPTRATLERIHANKTGALIRAAVRMGAIVGMSETGAGPARPDPLTALTDYAEAIGLLFQIIDDLLDVEQSSEQIGKRTGKDAAGGKLTYPGLLGVEASRRAAADLHARAVTAINPLGSRAANLRELADYMAVRTK
ncbi:MAG TPA: polyprenyl synthetase family protein [Phycisphaerales bacterium]|nr:polyprenyl synthetase family protein [Phycisphaerales bacterium]